MAMNGASPSKSQKSGGSHNSQYLPQLAGTDEELHQQLVEAKIARKRAEEDERLLANRIHLLRQEEEKARKKIDETKKRASDIIGMKQRNQNNLMEKEARRK